MNHDSPVKELVSTLLEYVYGRKYTFSSEVDDEGRMLSVVVPLTKLEYVWEGDADNTSVGVAIECTIFEDDSVFIELWRDQDENACLIASMLLPEFESIDIENLTANIIVHLRDYKHKNVVTGADQHSEIIIHFKEDGDDSEWDEHLGFKSIDAVDFWNEAVMKPLWLARDDPKLESIMCYAKDGVGKWMECG